MFDVDGCIRDDDGSKYLVLFGLEKYNTNLGQNQISYRIQKQYYVDFFSHDYVKIKIDLDDDLFLKEH